MATDGQSDNSTVRDAWSCKSYSVRTRMRLNKAVIFPNLKVFLSMCKKKKKKRKPAVGPPRMILAKEPKIAGKMKQSLTLGRVVS